jgi:hypothetical protein
MVILGYKLNILSSPEKVKKELASQLVFIVWTFTIVLAARASSGDDTLLVGESVS